jgi:hypothetical protein
MPIQDMLEEGRLLGAGEATYQRLVAIAGWNIFTWMFAVSFEQMRCPLR